jgi:hypothetical protein
MSEQDVINEVLICGLDDWLYLAEVKSIVHKALGDHVSETELIEPTIRVVEYLQQEELMEVGSLVPGKGFQRWESEKNLATVRIRREWNELRRPLSLWDICWLSLTEKGKQEAKRIIECGEAPPGVVTEE